MANATALKIREAKEMIEKSEWLDLSHLAELTAPIEVANHVNEPYNAGLHDRCLAIMMKTAGKKDEASKRDFEAASSEWLRDVREWWCV